MRETQPHGYLPSLDGWRALAIFGVLVCHGFDYPTSELGSLANERLHAWTRLGSYGVDVFFGLSGFLITSRLIAERATTGGLDLLAFYKRRAWRILPPVVTYLLVATALTLLGYLQISGLQLASSLLFFRNFVDSKAAGGWYTGHFWSLSVEEHFYLFWPALLRYAGDRRARWSALVLVVVVALWRVHEFYSPWLGSLFAKDLFFARTDMRIDGLIWGALGALVYQYAGWQRFWRQRWSVVPWLAAGMLFVASLKWSSVALLSLQQFLIVVLLIGPLLRPDGIRARLLSGTFIRYIGRLSYSLYVWQQLFLIGAREARPLPLSWLQVWPWNLACLMLCAMASYHFIEQPALRLAKGRSPFVGAKESNPLAYRGS